MNISFFRNKQLQRLYSEFYKCIVQFFIVIIRKTVFEVTTG